VRFAKASSAILFVSLDSGSTQRLDQQTEVCWTTNERRVRSKSVMADVNFGRVLGDRYRVDSLLAESEIATLYRGINTVVERSVIIKILATDLNDFQKTVLDEARDISRISDPNILSVSDLGTETDGTVYVVYEGFDGETLSASMNRDGQLPVIEAVDVTKQIADALAAVPATRSAYGMLSSKTVLVTDPMAGPRRVKVFNFFAPDAFNREGRNAVIVRGAFDTNFVAPEVATSGVGDERSDVYSLGALLFTMLAGEVPFKSESLVDVIKQSVENAPPPLSSFRTDLPPDLEPVILTAMAKNPEMRYQTVNEFKQQLDRATSGTAAAPATGGNNNLWKTAFIVLAGIAILATALIYATSVKQTDPRTQLQPDANGLPVQPINPATGAQEQALANMAGMPAEMIANSNMAVPPGTMPGGDGYDPWKGGGQPPAGAPNIGAGGQVITIDPNNPSQFMPAEGCVMQPSGILLCPAPLNANAAKKPTPTPKNAANANVQASPTPKITPETKPSPSPEKTLGKPATQKTPVPKASPGKPGDTN
jgi:hypothetical protein